MSGRQSYLILLSVTLLSLAAGCSTVSRMPQSPDQDAAKAAYDAFRKNQFQEAADGYMKAIAMASQSNPSAAARFKVSLAEVYREWAIRIAYAKKGESSSEDYMQAIKLCSAASELDPARKSLYDEMIGKFQSKISLLKYRAVANDEKMIPDFKPSHEKIKIFMTQARAYVLAGDYAEAKKHYEKVLAIDSCNAEAIRELSKVMSKLADAGAKRAAVERSGYVADVAWSKAEPLPAAASVAAQPVQTSKILRDTVIAKLELRQATLRDSFAKLESEAAFSGGVKFVFEGFNPDSKDWPLINFNAERIPLEEAISSLCSAVGLSYSTGSDGRVFIFRKM